MRLLAYYLTRDVVIEGPAVWLPDGSVLVRGVVRIFPRGFRVEVR